MNWVTKSIFNILFKSFTSNIFKTFEFEMARFLNLKSENSVLKTELEKAIFSIRNNKNFYISK